MDSVIKFNKCFATMAQALSGFLAAFNIDVEPTTSLENVFMGAENGITMYKMVGNSDTSVYPVVVSGGGHSSDGAIVTLICAGGAGVFVFEYDGDIYINHVYTYISGVSLSGWHKITTTAV